MNHVILCNSYQQVLTERKALADSVDASLGVTVATPLDFCEDLWAVWGDGRSLVSKGKRLALALAAVRRRQELVQSLGMVELLAKFVSRYAYALLDEMGDFEARCVDGLSLCDSERAFLLAAEDYFAELRNHDLIEIGQACALLSQLPLAFDVRTAGSLVMDPAMESLIAPWVSEGALARDSEGFVPLGSADEPDGARNGRDGLTDEAERERCQLAPLPEGVEAGFLFPAGPTATLSLLKRELLSFLKVAGSAIAESDGCGEESVCDVGVGSDGALRIAVISPEARRAYEALAPSLLDCGASCCLEDSLLFSESSFGRTFAAARVLCAAGEEGGLESRWKAAATDFAYSAWSGMKKRDAQSLDESVRGNRLFSCQLARERLSELSPTFGLFAGLFSRRSSRAYDELLSSDVVAASVPASIRMQEASLVNAVCDLAHAACELGLSSADVVDLAATLSVRVSVAPSCSVAADGNAPLLGGAASVDFISLNGIDALPAHSYDLVVVADVTENSFPVRPQDLSLMSLLGKLGVAVRDRELDCQRQRFECAMMAAKTRFACMLPLHDGNKEDVYPAFFLNEYISHLVKPDEPIRQDLFGVPERLVRDGDVLGEDRVADCLGQAQFAPEEFVVLQRAQRGAFDQVKLLECIGTVNDGGDILPILSPSALERYIACPYGWFVERFVRLNQLDEGFGPLEQGSFVHEVFAAFYERLAERGLNRISVDRLEQAHCVLDQVFDELLSQQSSNKQTRLIPISQADHLEVARLRELLHDNIEWQARFAPGFEVVEWETPIKVDDGIAYAGARLNGRADRVDVNAEERRFTVVDYKGSSSGHAAGFSEKDDVETYQLPDKVQTLMYAQALRKRFEGYACAGALYLGYRARSPRSLAAGSYSPLGYDAAGMVSSASEVCMDFEAFLDLVEEKIRPYVERLSVGDISLNPASKKACEYCPYTWCERRLS